VNLLAATTPSFPYFYAEPGTRAEKIRRGTPELARATRVMRSVENLYPDTIRELCFIDRSGAENARIVHGRVARVAELSSDESEQAFFAPTLALRPGDVYQAAPYISPDTHDWVISNSTVVTTPDGAARAMVHFEVSLDSVRKELGGRRFPLRIVDASRGSVVVAGNRSQGENSTLGDPADQSLRFLRGRAGHGIVSRDGRRVAYSHVVTGSSNANDWIVVATASVPGGALLAGLSTGTIALMLAALLLLLFAAGALRASQRRLRHAAITDDLTGLPNRVLFHDRVERGILAGRRDGLLAAVLLIDLDRFKEVNDTLGHRNGDLLLREVAARLLDAVRDGDTVARLGGDEFAVLLPRIPDADTAAAAASRIRASLAAPMLLDGVPVHVDCSIGIAVYPADADTAAPLLQRADVAMYGAKRDRTGCEFYTRERDDFTLERLALVPGLRRAIENDELVVYFQPKLDVASGAVHSVEALVRWQHPELGLVPPDRFIKIAEDTGLIKPLTLIVLERSLEQCREWRDQGLDVPVAVNLSVRNLLDANLLADIRDALARSGLAADRLLLEITESAMMDEYVNALAVLTSLSDMGVRLALDDFGTGYSSLAYLKQLPLTELKIDRSFVTNMAVDDADEMIVRSTIDLGHNLGLSTVAEGVEDEATLERLRVLGCDIAQGFLLSRPLPGAELTAWLHARRAARAAASDMATDFRSAG
jgi:diguanylate cyclase (GGDEF)-like protein